MPSRAAANASRGDTPHMSGEAPPRPSRRALVTGGSRGIGLAVARALAADGLEVVVTYTHDAEVARNAGERLNAEGLAVTIERCDAGSTAEVTDLFARIGGVDVVVHAAGFTRDRLLLMTSPRDFDEVSEVNLRGGFLAARGALSGMLAREWG